MQKQSKGAADESEFGRLIGAPSEKKAAFFGVSLLTLRRWCEDRPGKDAAPLAAVKLARIAFGGDLSAFGPEWSDVEITRAGLLLPGWRNPIPPGELRSAFWRAALVGSLESRIRQLEADLQKETAARDAAESKALHYRQMVRNEARAGWLASLMD